VKEDDLLYGAHSGLQKAVRRGDLDLCKTCFDLLWSEKKHRDWLKWRVSSIVLEEAWFFGGKLKRLQKSKSSEEKDWRKFFYELCLIRKVKDAGAIWEIPFNDSDSAELILAEKWRKKYGSPWDADISSLGYSLASACRESRELSEYESMSLEVFESRASMGGMFGDRVVAVGSILLLMTRTVDEAIVDDLIDKGVKSWTKKKGRRPRTVNLPWYVFDMHTQVGKIAMSVVKKKKKELIPDDLLAVWFLLESAYIPESLRVENLETPNAFEEKWWPIHKKSELEQQGGKDMIQIWDDSLRDHIKGIVEWLLEKRGGAE